MFEEFKAPDRTQPMISAKKIFLAGSIDMGSAEDWQAKVTKELKKIGEAGNKNITVFNPRRDDWDSTWVQEINNTQFFDQVSWELDKIDDSDLVIVYFTKDSKAPITLLELGKVSEMKDKNVLVFCPEGYHRKGNVDIVCYRKKIPVFDKFEDLISGIKDFLKVNKENTEESANLENFIEPVTENTKTDEPTLKENEICLRGLHGDPVMEFTTSEDNVLVVEDFDHIENSCMMGKIKFNGRTMYSGICNEDGKTKITLNIQKNDNSGKLVEFELRKADEKTPESVYLAD